MTVETPVAANTRAFHYYRQERQGRVRYRMVLDERNNLISDGPARDTAIPPPSAALLHPDDSEAKRTDGASNIAILQQRGFKFDMGADGSVNILHAPELEQLIARFFVPSSDCFFPACEQLRTRWLALLKSNDVTEDDCPDCVKSQLMNQFREHIEAPINSYIKSKNG